MAKATATCTCRVCGATFDVSAVKRNRRDADSWESWAVQHYDECPECREARIQAQRAEENKKAAEAAHEMGYPELIGTLKQVAWATTIRDKVITSLREFYFDPQRGGSLPEAGRIFEGIKKILFGHTLAGWWIEKMRDASDSKSEIAIIQDIYRYDQEAMDALRSEIATNTAQPAEDSQKAAQPTPKPVPERPEAIPEAMEHDGSVDLKIDGNTVIAIYEKNIDFMAIVKSMGFKWKDHCWALSSGEQTGTTENIVAELGNRLLNAGFAVRFDTQENMDAAVNGTYTPICRRWITSHPNGFLIKWDRLADDHYLAAKSLPGARYESPGMVVPERSWDSVIDYANKYGYRIAAKAQEKIDRLSGASHLVVPAPIKNPEYPEVDVLSSSREIIPDLKDDDS